MRIEGELAERTSRCGLQRGTPHRLQESMRTRGMRGCDEMRGGVRGDCSMGERSERSAVVMLPSIVSSGWGLKCVGEACWRSLMGRGGGPRKRHTQRGGGARGWQVGGLHLASGCKPSERRGASRGLNGRLGARLGTESCWRTIGAVPVFIWHSVPFTAQHQPSLPFACSSFS